MNHKVSHTNRVTFLSAGMLSPKKRDHPLSRRQLYLNYGALTLATKLEIEGYSAGLVHGGHRSPEECLISMIENGYLPSRYPLMLSLPSFYALPWAQEFCRLFKTRFPSIAIVAGGRWVVGPDPSWLLDKLPEVSRVSVGLSESIIESLLLNSTSIMTRMQSPTPNYFLNYRLVEDHLRFQPSLEASRGCGMGCAFCEERDIPLGRLRTPDQLAENLEQTLAQYNGGVVHPYIESSFFAPNQSWANKLAVATKQRNLNIKWRTETRADGMSSETVASLSEAGMSVVDIGLETASPSQILAMKKTNKPDRYLEKASSLLKACRDYGVQAKVNVLLYAGETEQTLKETTSWLDMHADCIKGVSVGPVVAYGPPKTANLLIEDWEQYGASPVDSKSAMETGITAMNLSKNIDAEQAENIALNLARRYMDSDDYYDLKSFSYYARDFTRSQFNLDVAMSNPKDLPFSINRTSLKT